MPLRRWAHRRLFTLPVILSVLLAACGGSPITQVAPTAISTTVLATVESTPIVLSTTLPATAIAMDPTTVVPSATTSAVSPTANTPAVPLATNVEEVAVPEGGYAFTPPDGWTVETDGGQAFLTHEDGTPTIVVISGDPSVLDIDLTTVGTDEDILGPIIAALVQGDDELSPELDTMQDVIIAGNPGHVVHIQGTRDGEAITGAVAATLTNAGQLIIIFGYGSQEVWDRAGGEFATVLASIRLLEDSTAVIPPAVDPQPNPSDMQFIADDGFRPDVHGFKFENYGGDLPVTNLTPAEMRKIFGDQVCASTASDGCFLTPPAEQWMEQMNESMAGGHCYGFSVLSQALYSQQINIADLGANTTRDLTLADNERVQREIAYAFVHQALDSVQSSQVFGTPSEILDTLIMVLKPNPTELYTIGIYKLDGTGGHAITPYAIADRGDGLFDIMVYDNNWPDQERAIRVDRNADTWRYDASINPDVAGETYEGNADSKSMVLLPMSPGLQQQPCPFCEEAVTATDGKLAAPTLEYNEIYMDSDGGHLLLTDEQGRNYGYVGDEFVSEIPGVEMIRPMTGDLWQDTAQPSYRVPATMAFTITIDGGTLDEATTSDVTMIGPGYDLGVSDIKLDPGQQDTLFIAPDGELLSYQTETGESPDMFIGVVTDEADYEFYVKGFEIEALGTVNLTLDQNEAYVSLDTIGNTEQGVYGLYVSRIDDAGEQIFGHDDIVLEPDDVLYIDYLDWAGEGDALPIDVDYGGDGKVDETIEISDVTNELAEEE